MNIQQLQGKLQEVKTKLAGLEVAYESRGQDARPGDHRLLDQITHQKTLAFFLERDIADAMQRASP